MIGRALGWGLLGTARINRMVIPAIRASAGSRLVGVASRDAARAEAYAREWGIGRSWGSYEALLEDPEVDAVYIPLPNHLHAEWAIRAARAGKHVLCEKPLALSVDEVDAMEGAAREAGVVLAEAFMYRHHPQTLRAKELVTSGAIGEVRFVRGSFTFPLPGRAEVEVAGTTGILRVRHPWKPDPAQPILLTQGEQTREVAVGDHDRYRLEIEDLAAAALGRGVSRVSLAESRRSVRTITALLRSAREGRPIRLGSDDLGS